MRNAETDGIEFLYPLGRLLVALEHPVDLVDLAPQGVFVQCLEEEGQPLQVGWERLLEDSGQTN